MTKVKIYFIIANALCLAFALATIVPDSLFTLRHQESSINVMERQLAVREANYRMYEEKLRQFAAMDDTDLIIIQPPGHLGALLTEIRAKLHDNYLSEIEFHASERALHYASRGRVAETRSVVVADGNYGDIGGFLYDMANHYRYIRLERIQISEESPQTRLWLTFIIYEEA